MNDLHAAPDHLPPLPDGEVYLGLGPLDIPTALRDFDGHMLNEQTGAWKRGSYYVGGSPAHYTAPLDSDITRHILSHRVPDGVPVLPEGWVYAGRVDEMQEDYNGKSLWCDDEEYWDERDIVYVEAHPEEHYAVPLDSPLARKLLGLERDTRPSWEDAPDDARYLAQNDNGNWYWAIGGHRPPEPCARGWVNEGGAWEHAGEGEHNPKWRETLEPRPAQEGHGTNRGDTDAKSEAIREAIEVTAGDSPAWGNSALLSELMAIAYARGYMGLNDEQIQDIQRGMRKALDDLERKLPSMLPDAPDLIIPKDAADQIGLAMIVEDLTEIGYRVEVDRGAVRGWQRGD